MREQAETAPLSLTGLPEAPPGSAAHTPGSAAHTHDAASSFARHRPEETVLYRTLAAHWAEFCERAEEAGGLPPIEEPAPDAEDPVEPSPVGPDPEQSQPAEGCTNRCLAMMDACDAGPRESTCESICTTAPTEGELACAEQVACENIGDWFNVCSLGV